MISLASLSALAQVVLVDLVLAGDNAIIVGLVASGLPKGKRGRVIMMGILAATTLRIIFALAATRLLQIIGFTLAGGLLLLFVCWKLWRELCAQRRAAKASHAAMPAKTVRQAVFQIVLADVSMSLDNVLAVAGAAMHHVWVLIIGLSLSVALMGLAASLVAKLLNRFPWISYAGIFIVLFVAVRMIWHGSMLMLHAG